MTSYDQWALLKKDAEKHGPACLALVERVGEARAQILFWEMAERFGDGSAEDYYKLTGAPTGLYEILEGELLKAEPGLLFPVPTDPGRLAPGRAPDGVEESSSKPVGINTSRQFTPSTYTLVLLDAGENRPAVMKTIRALWPGISLKQAQGLVNAVPVEICTDIRQRDADQVRKLFWTVGANIELRHNEYILTNTNGP